MNNKQNFYVKLNFMNSKGGFKTDLGNYHTLEEVIHNGQLIEYFTRNDKCMVFDNDESADNEIFYTNEEKIEYLKKHLKINSTLNKSGLYDALNDKPIDLNIAEIKNNIKNLNQNVWELIVSPPGELSLKYNFLSKDKWHKVLKENFEKLLKINNLDPNNINAYYVIHGNTENPHIHLFFYEKKITKKKGKFDNKSLNNFAYKFKLSIENNNLYEKINELTKNIWDARKELNVIIYDHLKNKTNNNNYKKYKTFLLASSQILAELKNKNNISYKKLSEENKLNINKIKDFLLEINNNDYANAYSNYQNQINELKELNITDKFLITKVNGIINNEIKDFEVQSGNKIIKALLASSKENKTFNNKNAIPNNIKKAGKFIGDFLTNLNIKPTDRRLINLAEKEFLAEGIYDLEKIEEYFKEKLTR